jgi:transposase-like protein
MSKTTNKFSSEVRARAVQILLDPYGQHTSSWTAASAFSTKIGYPAHTLLGWVKRAEVDSGRWAGVSCDRAEKLKAQERENRELRRAIEIRSKGFAYFANAQRISLTWSSTVGSSYDHAY